MRRLLLLVGFILLSTTAYAQRVCTTGKACGNSCIARNRTCRVGAGTAVNATDPAAASRPLIAPAPSIDSLPWVGSSQGSTYYRRGCSAGNRLVQQNRIYFRNEEEARRKGYSRSRSSGC